MRKALLPALIATMFAASAGAVSAAEMELLFGPGGAKPAAQAPVKKTVKKAETPVVEKIEVASTPVEKAPKVEKKIAKAEKAEAVAKKEPVSADPYVAAIAASEKPAKAEKKVAKAMAPKKEEKAPVVVAKKEEKAPTVVEKPVVLKPLQTAAANGSKVITHTDPLSVRDALAHKFTRQMSFGFVPSTTTSQDAFSIQRNYLPLMNLLSEDAGIMVNGMPERNQSKLRQKIANNDYPIILLNSALFADAVKAGYKLVAVSEQMEQPTFIVAEASKIKTFADAATARIALPASATQVALLARHEIAKAGLKDKAKVVDLAAGTAEFATLALQDNAADVVVVGTDVAEHIVSDNPGKYRKIAQGAKLVSSGIWVRENAAEIAEIKKIVKSVIDLSTEKTEKQKFAAKRLGDALAAKGSFVAADSGSAQDVMAVLEAYGKAWGADAIPEADAEKLAQNQEVEVITSLENEVETGSSVIKRKILASMKEGTSIGFMVPGSNSRDLYTFQNNFRPLSNYLSEKTGVVVSLIPEKNLKQFVERIDRKEYPAILIGPSMTQAAKESGYQPVARAGEVVISAMLVKVDSKAQRYEDLSGKRIATVRASDAAMVGRYELMRSKIMPSSMEYFGSSAESPSVLNSGAADAVLIQSREAEIIIAASKDGNGKPLYKMLRGREEIPSLSMWVRGDVVENKLMGSLTDVFQTFDNFGTGSKTIAFDGYTKATGYTASWKGSVLDDYSTALKMTEAMKSIDKDLYLVKDKSGSGKAAEENDDAWGAQFTADVTTPLTKDASKVSFKEPAKVAVKKAAK